MAMTLHSGVLIAAGGLFALTGCKETVEGKYLDTEGIALVAEVTAEADNKSSMTIDFLTGGDESNTYVDLSADEVTASGGGVKKTISAADQGEYDTSFATGKPGTAFTIGLTRSAKDKTDASKTSGKLPDNFKVTLDQDGDISRTDALTILWDPSGSADEVKIDIDGDCLFFVFEGHEPDDGKFTVPAKDLIFGGDPKKDDKGSCEATVTVTRTNLGEVDPVFDTESKFRLNLVRSTTFQSVP
jgi:hypothetical protein